MRREIAGPAGVRGEPYASRNVINRVEVANDPLVGQHSGEADHPMQPRRGQCVRQSRCSDQLEGSVDAVGQDVSHLLGDRTVVNQDMIDTDLGQRLDLAWVPGS